MKDMSLIDKDGNPLPGRNGGANQVRIGVAPEQGLILLHVGGGSPVGVDPANAIRLAHNILGKALALLSGVPDSEPGCGGLGQP